MCVRSEFIGDWVLWVKVTSVTCVARSRSAFRRREPSRRRMACCSNHRLIIIGCRATLTSDCGISLNLVERRVPTRWLAVQIGHPAPTIVHPEFRLLLGQLGRPEMAAVRQVDRGRILRRSSTLCTALGLRRGFRPVTPASPCGPREESFRVVENPLVAVRHVAGNDRLEAADNVGCGGCLWGRAHRAGSRRPGSTPMDSQWTYSTQTWQLPFGDVRARRHAVHDKPSGIVREHNR